MVLRQFGGDDEWRDLRLDLDAASVLSCRSYDSLRGHYRTGHLPAVDRETTGRRRNQYAPPDLVPYLLDPQPPPVGFDD